MPEHVRAFVIIIIIIIIIISGAPRARSVALYLSKYIHPRKFGNHVTIHQPLPDRPTVRPHHRETNVLSQCFILVWEPRCSLIFIIYYSFKIFWMNNKLLLCTLILSFAGQPEKFPWSGLQLVTKGHNSLAIFHISRTLRSILAVPRWMRPSARALVLPLYQYSEATYSVLSGLLQQHPVSPPPFA